MMTLRGIVPIPLETVTAAFQQHFPGTKDCGGTLEWEGDGSNFQVGFTFLDETTLTSGTMCCGDELLKSAPAMERFTRVISALGCRRYDLQQVDRRTAW